jgi:hypothetical protein
MTFGYIVRDLRWHILAPPLNRRGQASHGFWACQSLSDVKVIILRILMKSSKLSADDDQLFSVAFLSVLRPNM